jgi:hypothetical protein
MLIGGGVLDILLIPGAILVCPPCAKVRGYEPENLIPGD